jgi:uncharacterized protein YbcV (DUF1398 family)
VKRHGELKIFSINLNKIFAIFVLSNRFFTPLRFDQNDNMYLINLTTMNIQHHINLIKEGNEPIILLSFAE